MADTALEGPPALQDALGGVGGCWVPAAAASAATGGFAAFTATLFFPLAAVFSAV